MFDFFVEMNDEGIYKVCLFDDGVWSLYISGYYWKWLVSGEVIVEEKEYIKKKVNFV